MLTHLGVCRGAALATVERLLSCTSSHNMTKGESSEIASAPWNSGGGAAVDTTASSAAKEWRLIGEP